MDVSLIELSVSLKFDLVFGAS